MKRILLVLAITACGGGEGIIDTPEVEAPQPGDGTSGGVTPMVEPVFRDPDGKPVLPQWSEGPDEAVPGEPDAGDARDAGSEIDAGAEPDAGLAPDAGHRPDAGSVADAGVHLDAGVHDAGTPPSSPTTVHLDTSVVSLIVEPDGSGHDDLGTSYTDKNYWNFCVPGAVTAALYYWKPANVTGWAAGHFREPSHAPSTIPAAGTYWKSSGSAGGYANKGRAYLMYLAMKVKPPSWGTAGIDNFSVYPTTGANLVDARDALNWEASGHSAGWSTFFYAIVYASTVTQSRMHTHLTGDLRGGHAVVIFADTGYLPNWSRSLSHAITVVGFDDRAGTYQYIDTCGKRCNGASQAKNGGVWTISQSRLTQAVQHGAGYVW
jgi:hypothetical protein